MTRDQTRLRSSRGWDRPSSCSATTTPPKRELRTCSSFSPTPSSTPSHGRWRDGLSASWSTTGETRAGGVDLCREAVQAAPSALTRLLAVLYLGVALLDAGAYQEAVNEMLDAGADARLTGLDRSFGGYLDASRGGGAHSTRPLA